MDRHAAADDLEDAADVEASARKRVCSGADAPENYPNGHFPCIGSWRKLSAGRRGIILVRRRILRLIRGFAAQLGLARFISFHAWFEQRTTRLITRRGWGLELLTSLLTIVSVLLQGILRTPRRGRRQRGLPRRPERRADLRAFLTRGTREAQGHQTD